MVPVMLNRPSRPSTVSLDQTQLDIERLGQILRSQCVAQRTSGHNLSALEQHDMRNAGRNLLNMMGDKDRRWCVVILSQLAQSVDQRLAAGQVQTGGRLVKQQKLRISHQCPCNLHSFALTLTQGAECPIRQRIDTELSEQLVGPFVV